MLMVFALVLLILWVLGVVTSYTVGGLLHILIFAAVILFIVQLIQGRRT